MSSVLRSGDSTGSVYQRGGNKAATRVLDVLSMFTDDAPSHGVTELSRRLGWGKGLVFRALATLTDKGILIRDESGFRYQLGFRLLELGQRTLNEPDIRSLCGPYMRRMWELSGETLTLSVPVGRLSVIIDGIQGRGPVARRVPLGRMTPLHASSASRAILAFLTDEEIDTYLAEPLERFTPTTRTEPHEVWEMIRTARAQGFVTGYGDYIQNTGGIGFPVLDRSGHAVGSVTVSGPDSRLTHGRIAELLPDLREIASELNCYSRLCLQLHAAPEVVPPQDISTEAAASA